MRRSALMISLGVLTWACGEAPEASTASSNPPSAPQWETGIFETPQGPRELTYQKVDGQRILEGDIILPEPLAEREGVARQGLAALPAWGLWPDGVVPVFIDPALPNPARVHDAMTHWHMRTRIRFVTRSTEAAYVHIRPTADNVCNANIGRGGGLQFVNLGPNCPTGTVIHELGHTVGLWHEQSRADRDANVIVQWGNIQPGMEFNFQTYLEQGFGGQDVGPYDIGSIMHYDAWAFSRNGAPTLTRRDGSTFNANRAGLSGWDEAGISALYGPPARLKVKYGPAVTSRNSGNLDLFAVGETGTVFHRLWSGRWYNWLPLGGVATASPAAVSWGPGRLDVFVRGVDNQLHHKWYDGNAWSGWEGLGGCLSDAPAASSWGAGRIDVFVRGCDGVIYHKWFEGGWSAWESMGASSYDGPAAVSWGPGRVDLFIRGTNNALWQRYFDFSRGGWSGWGQLGGVLTSGPAVASWGSDRLDVFVRGGDFAMHHKAFDRPYGGWFPWDTQGGGLASAPAAESRQAGVIDIFVTGTDSYLHQMSWWGGWSGWSAVP